MPEGRSIHGSETDAFGKALNDAELLDELFGATYGELRRLASAVRRRDSDASLSPTALVNEAWLKLRESPKVARLPLLHFKRIAARAMRQVLVEAARRRQADKRGGGAAWVTFDEAIHGRTSDAEDVLALDDALHELARIEPRQAMLVESRFFGGLEAAEIAEMLDVSESTVLRDWRSAKAWLAREMKSGR